MNKNDNIIIRVNENTKNDFKSVLDNNGFKLSEVFNTFMEDVISNGDIPEELKKKISKKHLSSFDMSIFDIKKVFNNVVKSSNFIDKIVYSYLSINELNEYLITVITVNDFDVFDQNDLYQELLKELALDIELSIIHEANDFDSSNSILIYERK